MDADLSSLAPFAADLSSPEVLDRDITATTKDDRHDERSEVERYTDLNQAGSDPVPGKLERVGLHGMVEKKGSQAIVEVEHGGHGQRITDPYQSEGKR